LEVDSMPGTAVLFPGQGSHTDEMRELVEDRRPDLLDAAAEVVGEDPFARAGEATRFAQPAIYCASLAGWSLVDRDEADVLAGHSLGELTALAAAGALDELDGLRLVALRGRLMDEAAGGDGGMLAVRGGLNDAAAIAERNGLVVANDNAPDQVVLSGPAEGIDAARKEARAAGIKALRLPVGGAFHSPSMKRAATRFDRALGQVEFRPASVPVVSCLTAAVIGDPRTVLAAALTNPVRWRETLLALDEMGVRRFVETGPGQVLTGIVGRTLDGVGCFSVAEPAHA
jgi:malonyl CoA-acyl carrier protein transacylase